MSNIIYRMKPDSINMVTQAGPYNSIDILCVECGWEEVCFVPTAPWTIFKDHPCRLIAQHIASDF